MTGPDDKDLEKYLAGGSRVSRDYDALGQEQPPAGLDSRILAEAAAAVGVKKTRRRPPLWWLRPAALAATVLVSLSILLRLGEFPPAPAFCRGENHRSAGAGRGAASERGR